MSEIPGELRFLQSHEWARLEEDGTITVGITDYAQQQLGDVVFVELPAVNTTVTAGEEVAVVESVKAASDLYAPVSGEIIATNRELENAPEQVNQSPYDTGWFYRVRPEQVTDFENLLDADGYSELCAAER